jgi:RND superfamily putative drug exporter
MQLAGKWNWWMPAWLDRAIPNVSVEAHHGEALPAVRGGD